MVDPDLDITLGVEEEFFLVDPETRDVLADPDRDIFEMCKRTRGPNRVVGEFLRSQIETNTHVCASMAELRQALRETRRVVCDAAARATAPRFWRPPRIRSPHGASRCQRPASATSGLP